MSDPITRLNAALAGRYRIERLLGEGGMATVYLADDLRHQRNVALKVLRPDLAAVVGAERFLAEIKTTANLQHPHILPLFDSGEADSFLFYVMPYVEGETLRDRIDREKQLPVEESIRIATAVAGALDYAHRHGVIHRDIKPANILLHDGQPVVSDFGIALAVGAAGGNRLTETGLSVGTPYYMSPEQATGDQQVGPPSDTYALACVLYEMLTGDPPYLGSTAQAVLGQIIAGEPVSLIKKRRTVPANVDAAVRRALEKLPADRFTSAQDFAKALADPAFRHGDDAATGARGSSIPWRRASIATGAWAVAASVAAAWALTRPAAPGPVTRYSVALPADQAYRAPAARTGLALTPDGGQFIYGGAGPQGEPQLWLRPRDQLTASPLAGTEGAGDPSVSPDGSKFAFVTSARGRREIMVATIGGGTALMIEDSLVDNGGVSWGYDGYIYYDGHLEGDGLARVPEGGGTPEPVTTPRTEEGEVWHQGPHALPNGRGVLFNVWRGGTFDVAVVDLATGGHRILVPGALAPRYSPTGHLVYVHDDGTLVAAPFDQDRLTLTGDGIAIADGVQVRNQGRVDLALAGDGTLMYVSGDDAGIYEMVWATRGGAVSVIDPDWAPGNMGQPALSPDGRQLAVTAFSGNDSQIWLKQLDRGRFTRFTLEGTSSGAAWSPDGRTIALSSQRGGYPMAYRRSSDGSAPPELLHQFPDRGVNQVAYSADGRWLLDAAEGNLFGVRLDRTGAPEGEPVPLATGPFLEIAPALSPDGRWLAYSSEESGQYEVYVCPFPSSCEARHLVSSAGGVAPIWARSGRELFFLRPGGPLVAVEVLPGPTFDWGEEREIMDASGFRQGIQGGFDVAPDGQRFVFARPVGGTGASQLVVVENFFRVLREQVGR